MKPPFAYFGGKTRLAPWIASLIPPHRLYVEPFCGSAAVLFAKPRVRDEIINDLDGDVVTFFRVLRDRPDELERACLLTPYARDEWRIAVAGIGDEVDELEQARRWFVRSTQTFGRIGTGASGWSISVTQNTNKGRATLTKVAEFAAIAERLAGCMVEHRDALECITRFDTHDAVIYCDPPYLAETRTSFNDERGWARRPNGDYQHEFHTEEDHRELAAVLSKAAGHVLLSGYPSSLYDELYDGWWRHEQRVVSSSARAPRVEVIWSNRPPDRLFGEEAV